MTKKNSRRITVFTAKATAWASCPDCGDTYQEGQVSQVEIKLGEHGFTKHQWTDVLWSQSRG